MRLFFLLLIVSASIVLAGTWQRNQPDPVPTFARTSVAYLDGRETPAAGRRSITIAIPSTSDGSIAVGEGVAGTAKNINAAGAVDKGAGLVGIPCDAHGFTAGVTNVRIAGTTNYNGDFLVYSQTTNEFVIQATYVSETFSGATATPIPLIRPHGSNGTYLYGIDIISSRLYKSTDGATWDRDGLYATAIVGGLFAMENGTLIAAINGGRGTPGVTPADITETSTSVADGSSDALLTKTNAFTASTRPTGSIAYIVFPTACPVSSGFYTITRISDSTAKITPVGGSTAVTWSDFGSATTTWWAQDCYYNGADTCYGSSGTGGKLQINKTSGFSTLFANGTRIWVAFANTNSKYTTGYYKYERVSDNACFLINETTGSYILYDAAADNQYCAYCIGQGFLRSADNGATFSVCTYKPECSLRNTTFPGTAVTPWAFRRQGTTILAGEYGGGSDPGAGRYLHRSTDDGLTWTPILDLLGSTFSPNKGRHIHSIGYHAATSQWIVSVGDLEYAAILTSDDDGITWTLIRGTGNCNEQPISFVDAGDATRILGACDSEDTVAWIDMTTGEGTPCFNRTERFETGFYAFTICKVGDVYYAGGYDPETTYTANALVSIDVSEKQFVLSGDKRQYIKIGQICKLTGTAAADGFYTVSAVSFSTNTTITVAETIPGSDAGAVGYCTVSYPHAPALWVSTNLSHWSVYHKFKLADECIGFGGWYAGYAGGKLHFAIQVHSRGGTTETTVYRHFSISPATVQTADLIGGALIEPAVTNLLTTTDKSSFEAATDITVVSGTATVSRDATIAYHGSASTKVACTGTGTTAVNVKTGDFTVNAAGGADPALGKPYVFSFAVKSSKPVQIRPMLFAGTSEHAAIQHTGVMSYSTWQRHWSCVWVPISAASNFHIEISIVKYTDPVDVWLDSFQLQALPLTEFQIGGTAKTADVLTETVAAPYEWTDVFAVQTIGQHWHYLGAANEYLRTWKVGSDEIQLYYNITNSKFYIQRNAETAVASAAQEWHPNQVIKFALRANSAGLTLDIQNGRAKEQITDSALAAVLNASLTIITGDVSSANQFPGVYLDGSMMDAGPIGFGFIPFKMTDADVAATFNLAPTVVVE